MHTTINAYSNWCTKQLTNAVFQKHVFTGWLMINWFFGVEKRRRSRSKENKCQRRRNAAMEKQPIISWTHNLRVYLARILFWKWRILCQKCITYIYSETQLIYIKADDMQHFLDILITFVFYFSLKIKKKRNMFWILSFFYTKL